MYKKKSYVPRNIQQKTMKLQPYKFIQRVPGFNMTGTSTALTTYNGNINYIGQSTSPVGWGISFRLNDLAQNTTFTALFDQYRIMKVVVYLRPQTQGLVQTTSAAATPNVNPQGNIYTAVDPDSATAQSISSILQYQTCRIQAAGSPKTIVTTIYPQTTGGTLSGGTTVVAASGVNGRWLDCGVPSVDHFGFLVSLDNGSANYLQIWEIDALYFLEFRSVR